MSSISIISSFWKYHIQSFIIIRTGHFLFAIVLQTLRNKNVKAAAFGLEDFFNLGEFKCALIAVAVDC